jgi:hypothetical protein
MRLDEIGYTEKAEALRRNGWFMVERCDRRDESQRLYHTIGFTLNAHPELVLTGLTAPMALTLFSLFYRIITQSGELLIEGFPVGLQLPPPCPMSPGLDLNHYLLQKPAIAFCPLGVYPHRLDSALTEALTFFRSYAPELHVTALQLVYKGQDDCYPFESAASSETRNSQDLICNIEMVGALGV